MTLSDAIGVSRSSEPAGVLPRDAWRLDNHPDLRPGEARLDVEMLRLPAGLLAYFRDTVADEPGARRAALLETVAERGKLQAPHAGSDGSVVGRVAASADHPSGVAPGRRALAAATLGSVPLWLRHIAAWDGASPIVPATGHAIVLPTTPLAVVRDDLDTVVAVSAAETAPVVAALRRLAVAGGRVALLGGTGGAGAVAGVAAREGGARSVAVTVATLRDARLIEHVGAATPVVCDPSDAVEATRSLRVVLGGPADVAVAAAGAAAAAALTVRDGGTVVVAPSNDTVAEVAASVRAVGRDIQLLLAGGHVAGEVALTLDLVAEYPRLRAVIAGHTGTGTDPTLDAARERRP